MIKKAFILGAGLGTRLRPLTNVLPKPLVPIFHEPMANYALRHCISAGIESFAINTHHIPEAWNQAYPNGEFEGTSIDFFHEETLLETGGGIRNIASFIGNDPLLIYNGDILTDIDISQLIKQHEASGHVATLALRSSGENCNVSLSGELITDMRSTLTSDPETHQFTGIYCINPEIIDLIPDEEVVSIVPAFIELIKVGKLGAVVLDDGHWLDIGNPQTYRDVHRQLLESAPSDSPITAIHPDAKIHPDADVCSKSCVVGPDVEIPASATVKNTIIWPSVKLEENSRHDGEIIIS